MVIIKVGGKTQLIRNQSHGFLPLVQESLAPTIPGSRKKIPMKAVCCNSNTINYSSVKAKRLKGRHTRHTRFMLWLSPGFPSVYVLGSVLVIVLRNSRPSNSDASCMARW
jgi:hypothetical protein